MIIFLYSSPYYYYAENLISLAKYFKKMGHEVYGSYKLSIDGQELSMLDNTVVNYSEKYLKNKIIPDKVILTQTWWYQDAKIAKKAKEKLYVIDHAPPMMRFTQPDGKKSHLYRKDNIRQKYISWGKNTVNLMKEVGYDGINKVLGSSRLEYYLENIKNQKDGYVLFDTSERMEDESLIKLFLEFVKNNKEKQFIIQEHSRSSKKYRIAEKFDNVYFNKKMKEFELFEYNNFIFTFPSSAMLIPAIQNKNIYALYENHFCLEAREYFNKYNNCIFNLQTNNMNFDFRKFISNNILYKEEQSANERIYKYILES